MDLTLETIGRNAACAAVAALLDGGTLDIEAADGTVLAALPMGNPAFGAPVTGTAAAAPITADDAADAAGTAARFTARNAQGAAVLSGSVTATGGGGVVEIDNPVIVAGQRVEVTGFSLIMPAAAA